MRCRVAIAGVALSLGLAASASAAVEPPAWVSAGVVAAQSYWGAPVPAWQDAGFGCRAVPPVEQVALGAIGGQASYATCAIQINSDDSWTPYSFCVVTVHEWGHLQLGPLAFAAANPADPAHSLDPLSVMQEDPAIFALEIPQCRAMQNELMPRPGPTAIAHDIPAAGPVKHRRGRRRGLRVRSRL